MDNTHATKAITHLDTARHMGIRIGELVSVRHHDAARGEAARQRIELKRAEVEAQLANVAELARIADELERIGLAR